MKRPKECIGCPAEPSHPKYDSSQTGPFVPPSCDCPQHQGGPALPGDPCEATMLVIGMAPSGEEVAEGRPLVGPAGRKFEASKEWAKQSLPKDVPHAEIYTKKMNLVQCRTCQPGLSRDVVNRDPATSEVKQCAKRFLIPELRRGNAYRAIVPMGQLVHRHVMDQDMKFNESLNARIKHPLANAIRNLEDD